MSKSAGSDALSNEYIMWAIDAYDDKRLRWRDMDDATMDIIEHELRKRKRKKIAQKFESWRQEAIDKLDECRTLVEASSHDLAAVRSLLPSSSAPPRLAPSISASEPMQAALEHEEAGHSHDTLVLADPGLRCCDLKSGPQAI